MCSQGFLTFTRSGIIRCASGDSCFTMTSSWVRGTLFRALFFMYLHMLCLYKNLYIKIVNKFTEFIDLSDFFKIKINNYDGQKRSTKERSLRGNISTAVVQTWSCRERTKACSMHDIHLQHCFQSLIKTATTLISYKTISLELWYFPRNARPLNEFVFGDVK